MSAVKLHNLGDPHCLSCGYYIGYPCPKENSCERIKQLYAAIKSAHSSLMINNRGEAMATLYVVMNGEQQLEGGE